MLPGRAAPAMRPSDQWARVIGMRNTGRRRGRLGVGYRIGYRIRWFLFHIFGPPQTTPKNDPILRLRREREERLARSARKQRK
jgi:hypothetical protein